MDHLARIIYAFASVSGLGILFGVGLAVASKILSVQKNERVTQLEEALPGLNCGTCGFAGCSAYAEALAETDRPSVVVVKVDYQENRKLTDRLGRLLAH